MKKAAVLSFVIAILAFAQIPQAHAQQDVEAEMNETVRGFADGLNTISDMQKAKRSTAEQIAALCPIIFTYFDITYVHGESLIWIKNGNPNADIDQISRPQQEKLLVAYFAMNLLKHLKPLFEVLLTNPYQYTLVQSRKPVDAKTQKYVQHAQEIVFQFRKDPAAKSFIAFMTPGHGSLIRTSTVSDMYGKSTLTSLGAKSLSRKSVAEIEKTIGDATKGALVSCP